MSTAARPAPSAAIHAFLVVPGFTLLFTWLFAEPIVHRRLRDLSRDSRLLRAESLAASPLRLATRASVTLNFRDVTAVTAVAA